MVRFFYSGDKDFSLSALNFRTF